MHYLTDEELEMPVREKCELFCRNIRNKNGNKNRKSKTNLDNGKNESLDDLYSLVKTTTIPLHEMICYEPRLECAEQITDMTILLAKSLLTGTEPKLQPEYNRFKPKKTIWPKTGELSYSTGLRAVDTYIQSLQSDITLKYCLDVLKQLTDNISTTFIYEVKWSIPTKEEPVQISTADMYFYLKSYHAHPRDSPIDVTYSYEYSSLLLRPGEVKLKENWLLDIMEAKTNFRTENDFRLETFL